VAVLVENGKHGSSTAGPIAKAVFDYVVHNMNHTPTSHQTEMTTESLPLTTPPTSTAAGDE
jgi:penicillin-binding protein 2